MKPALRKFVRREMDSRVKVFARELRHAADHPDDLETLHDLGVSIRRLTQCLRIFEGCLEKSATRKIRKRIRKVRNLCGEARNYDIALELLRGCGFPQESLAAPLHARRQKAEKGLAKHLKHWRSRDLLKQVEHRVKLQHPPAEPWKSSATAAEAARSLLPGLASALFAQGDRAARARSRYQDIHQFRLQVKRYRYTVEIFAPLYGHVAASEIEDLRRLQDDLGKLNDCVTSLPLIGRHPDARRVIRKLMEERQQEFKKEWHRRFNKALRARWWRELSKAAA